MSAKISVIIPIYRVEKYIRQCLNSVISQTYQNLEIILVDDGSPDNCGSICDEYAKKDSRIVIIHQKNQGVSIARNVGIDMATGEWIMFVDPDDWLELDCCSRIMEIADNSEDNVIYFQRQMDDEEGNCIIKYPDIASFQLNDEMIQSMKLDCYIGKSETMGFQSVVPWAKVYSRKFLRDNHCRFPNGLKKNQDIIFNLYCQEYMKRASYYNYVGYHNRINHNSVCQRYNKEMLDIALHFLNELEKLVIKFHANDSNYIKALGVCTYSTLALAENLFFFYPQKEMAFKKYVHFMNIYYKNKTVCQYMNACKKSDCYSYRQKIRYFFISRHWLFPYYCIQRCWQDIKYKDSNHKQLLYEHGMASGRA